jgi:anti-sigma B factor antagonist
MAELPQPFFAARTSADGRTLLEVGGDCDAAALDALNDALADAVEQDTGEVVVDLARTTFVDSLALAALVAAAKRARACGRSFRVVRPRASVRRIFEITGLDRYLLSA